MLTYVQEKLPAIEAEPLAGWVEGEGDGFVEVGTIGGAVRIPRSEVMTITRVEFYDSNGLFHFYRSMHTEEYDRLDAAKDAARELSIDTSEWLDVVARTVDPWIDFGAGG